MVWWWRYSLAGEPATTGDFPDQGEAEAWIAQEWRELYDGGAREVTLLENDRQVYLMSLEPAD